MKYFVFLSITFPSLSKALAQNIGIGTTTPDASAKLDITSTSSGLLVPRMSSLQRTNIATPAQDLLVYDTDTNTFWFYNASAWTNLSVSASAGWSLTGNAGTNPSTHFMGTTDNQPLRWRVNNTWAGEIHPTNGNVFFGLSSGQANTTGYQNTANGANALKLNTSGHVNTALGNLALAANTTEHFTTAIGGSALSSNTAVGYNTATGSAALYFSSTGNYNTATGYGALYLNSTGISNTATGYQTLYKNSTGLYNTANGSSALESNTEGYLNTSVGAGALYGNTIGFTNVAVGSSALRSNTIGYSNTSIRSDALLFNTIGRYNTAIGYRALINNKTGDGNSALGYDAGPNMSDLSNTTCIGNGTIATANNQMVLGNANVTQFYCYGAFVGTTAFASNLTVLNTGQIVRSTSSRRYKKDITDLEINTSNIYKLKPVSYNSHTDDTRHFGLIAEEVADVIPELAMYSKEKDVVNGSASDKVVPDAVQYPLLSVLMLKEVQKHEKMIAEQQMIMGEMKMMLAAQQQEIEALKKKLNP